PYDSTVAYAGSCDADYMYWTRTGLLPNCDPGNTRFVEKTAFVCKKASRQILGIGLFQGVMVQYRADNTGAERWRTLAQSFNTQQVECQDDSGFDGDGSLRYAQAGTDLNPYTDNPEREVAWGSFPASESYTVFDGNYLNWRATPEKILLSRMDIVKTATKIAMDSINSSNIGIMRFNERDGGPVIQGMIDLDSNRAALAAVVDGITANGRTPLSETMYEAALYWLGRPAHYGELISEHPTAPNALISTLPEVYAAPKSPVCTKNYNVLLTDGEPVDDFDTPLLAPTLPNFSSKLGGRTACIGLNQGDCLDDITEYLSIPDLNPDQKGDQFVTTHTIGFTINLPILQAAADVSGGDYYLADDVENLTLALLQIFKEANEQELAFTAPAVAVNAFNRTQNLNDLYMSVFRSQTKIHWPGNLKKYRLTSRTVVDGNGDTVLVREITDSNGAPAVDPLTGFFAETAKSFWTVGGPDGREVELGGAANQLLDPLTRKVYTNNGNSNLTAGTNSLSSANAASFTLGDFGLSGATGEPTIEQMMDWMRGADVRDEDNNPATTQRNVMGDPLHSQPATLVYGGSPGNEDVVIYAATNDGYLHAIDAATGIELWSFVPKELLPRAAALMFNPESNYKSYGIDGDVVPVFLDRDNNGIIEGTDFAYLVFGLRRGGSSYYALDVTDKNSPKLLWNASYPGMGQSWSRPVVTRVKLDDPGLNSESAVVIVGAGYDPVHDTPTFPATDDNSGAGILMLDLKSGAELWRAGRDVSADLSLAGMSRAIPSQIRAIDLDGDRFADRMYAADVGGQLWRFDIFGGQPAASLVTGGVVAQLGAEGIGTPTDAETRRIYNSPDAALFIDAAQNRQFLAINIGTGYRAHPLDTRAADAFYSFRDSDVFSRLSQFEYDNYDVATAADFVEVSGSTQAVITANDRGWKFTLPADQMVLANSAVFNDEIFFVAFSPDTVAAQDCSVRVGRNFLYRVSLLNGDPIVDNISTVADASADNERVTELQQGGIAPSPTFLFPSPEPNCVGDACKQPPLGCVGVECFDPGFENNPVRTLWTQDGIE
ncbi:MAG: PilC/PilY family type IV pilus protein, partial [Gammaproteobacteria bacterium]|nr:PilC/PilY family type IV pilus protein [Gammaproteobacteria bacterium]